MECTDVLILAGGQGVRFKSDKMGVKLRGVYPYHILEKQAQLSKKFSEIVIVGPNGKVPGGSSRKQSIINGLMALSNSSSEFVVLSDAARFLVTLFDFQLLVDQMVMHDHGCDAIAYARPLTNSVMYKDGKKPHGLTRENYYETHTPHIFRRDKLIEIVQSDIDEIFPDEFSYAVDSGKYRCMTLPGNWRTAMKLTNPEDLSIMEALYYGFKSSGDRK